MVAQAQYNSYMYRENVMTGRSTRYSSLRETPSSAESGVGQGTRRSASTSRQAESCYTL